MSVQKKISLSEAERRLGYTRQTLAKWLDDLGLDYADGVDVRALLEARFEQERTRGAEDARKKMGLDDRSIDAAEDAGWISEDEAKRRKLIAQMVQEEIKADQARAKVVPVDMVAGAVREEYGKVRDGVMNIAARASGKCEGLDKDGIYEIILSECRAALATLREDAKARLRAAGTADADAGV